MDYKIHDVIISQDDMNAYLEKLINKLYAMLPIYEDCTNDNDYQSFTVYVKRLMVEISGMYSVLGTHKFLTLVNILTGMSESTGLSHDEVKSLTFYCISLIKGIKVV